MMQPLIFSADREEQEAEYAPLPMNEEDEKAAAAGVTTAAELEEDKAAQGVGRTWYGSWATALLGHANQFQSAAATVAARANHDHQPLQDVRDLQPCFATASRITAFAWLVLVIAVYACTPREQWVYLNSKERQAAAWAFGVMVLATFLLLSPLGVSVYQHGGTTAARPSSRMTGIIQAAVWIQMIAMASNALLAFAPTIVVVDPVTQARVYLIRWCEWIPLAGFKAFLSDTVDLPRYANNSHNKNRGMRVSKWLGLSQAFSCLCGVMLPLSPNLIVWSSLMLVAVSAYLCMFPRLWYKRLMFLATVRGTTFWENERYDRIQYGYYLMMVCTIVWTLLVVMYFLIMIINLFIPAIPDDLDDNIRRLLPGYYKLRHPSTPMMVDTLFDVISKAVYVKLMVQVHHAVFDEQGRTERQLSELRRLMAVLWDSSSDVIVMVVETATGPSWSTTSMSCHGTTMPQQHLTAMFSPSWVHLLGATKHDLPPAVVRNPSAALMLEVVLPMPQQRHPDPQDGPGGGNKTCDDDLHLGDGQSCFAPQPSARPRVVAAFFVDSTEIPDHRGGATASRRTVLASLPVKGRIARRALEVVSAAWRPVMEERIIQEEQEYLLLQQQLLAAAEAAAAAVASGRSTASASRWWQQGSYRRGPSSMQPAPMPSAITAAATATAIRASAAAAAASRGVGMSPLSPPPPVNGSSVTKLVVHPIQTLRKETCHCEIQVSRHGEHAAVAMVRDVTERYRRFEAEQRAHAQAMARQRDAAAVNRFTRHEIKNGLLSGIELCDSMRKAWELGMEQDEQFQRWLEQCCNTDGGNPTLAMSGSCDETMMQLLSSAKSPSQSPSQSLADETAIPALTTFKDLVPRHFIDELDKTLHEVLDTVLAEAMARDVIHEVYLPRLERLDVRAVLATGLGLGGDGQKERFPIVTLKPVMPDFHLDPQLLRYIHRNAVSNACKYGKPGAKVVTKISFKEAPSTLRLEVINEPGPGHEELMAMGSSACETVFCQGTRLHGYLQDDDVLLKDKLISSGDGAWIMQKCAKTMGGKCRIQFEPDHTCFSFECPVTPLEAVDDDTSTKDFEVPEDTWGIAVDDSKIQRKLMSRILSHAGIHESKRVVLGQDVSEMDVLEKTVFRLVVDYPDSKILLLVDENLDFGESQPEQVMLSGSVVMKGVLDKLTRSQEARVLCLVRSANDSAADVASYTQRVHGFFPKAPMQRDRVREVLAPLWAERFCCSSGPSRDDQLSDGTEQGGLRYNSKLAGRRSDSFNESRHMLEDEMLGVIKKIDDYLAAHHVVVIGKQWFPGDVPAKALDDIAWFKLWSLLHSLKGDLMVVEVGTYDILKACKLISDMRGPAMPEDLAEKWMQVRTLVLTSFSDACH